MDGVLHKGTAMFAIDCKIILQIYNDDWKDCMLAETLTDALAHPFRSNKGKETGIHFINDYTNHHQRVVCLAFYIYNYK